MLAADSRGDRCLQEDFQSVFAALKAVRLLQAGLEEAAIRDALSETLVRAGIEHCCEFVFSPHCRADLWVSGIVVEVKKQRPVRASFEAQVKRYAEKENVRGLIVVLERSIQLPRCIAGKPVAVLSLNAQWGIAL